MRRDTLLLAQAGLRRAQSLDWASGIHSRTLAQLPDPPTGLATLPDGRLLLPCGAERSVRVVDRDGSASRYADLAALSPGRLAYMVVDRTGGVFISTSGDSVLRIAAPGANGLAGPASVALTGKTGLSGVAITPDGNTLLIVQASSDWAQVLQARIAGWLRSS